jgi:hypothetical protein
MAVVGLSGLSIIGVHIDLIFGFAFGTSFNGHPMGRAKLFAYLLPQDTRAADAWIIHDRSPCACTRGFRGSADSSVAEHDESGCDK